jgi:hypothetical protein
MSLAPRTRLGSYEILSSLGAGSMGEVYRAKDTKLHREVALKILPDSCVNDPDRLARFKREARVLASLNHPYIAQIHDLEESDQGRALVMELVEGSTLAERIAQGALPPGEALPIARQIAEALEAAHEQGIVHRDLKPANIKIREDGTVKLLDFGLAKALEPISAAAGQATASYTMTSSGVTGMGVILGTAAYMSPEQARGRPLDKRTDIWAFGCVLYEMLAGRRAFGGDSVSDTIAAVIEREPNWKALPRQTPASLQRLLGRCLEKDQRRRLRDVGDARIEIDEALTRPVPQAEGIHVGAVPRRVRASWIALVSALAVSTITALLGWWGATRPTEPGPQPLVRLDVDLGPDVVLGSVAGADAVLSPDGHRLVFVSRGRLFSRRLDQTSATELAGSEGAFAPFFKPDGRWVAFFAEDKLKKVSVDGGKAVTLCDAPAGRGGSWGEDDTIIATLTRSSGLSRVPSAGGAAEPLTALASGEFTHRWPQVMPGSKAVLFTVHTNATGFDEASIDVVSLTDRRRQTLSRKATFGRYVAGSHGTGYLTYVSRGTLYAIPFDTDRLEVRGKPSPVLEQVSYNPSYGFAQLDVSTNGTLVYRSSRDLTVQWMDVSGKTQPLMTRPGDYSWIRLSADGNRLAVVLKGDLWMYDWPRGGAGARYLRRPSGVAGVDGGRSLHRVPVGGRHVMGARHRRLHAAVVDPQREHAVSLQLHGRR